jgi:hypothetical protein
VPDTAAPTPADARRSRVRRMAWALAALALASYASLFVMAARS